MFLRTALLICCCALFVFFDASSQSSFKDQQLKYPRVREAFKNRESVLADEFDEKGVSLNNAEIFLRGFKQEQILELWAREKGSGAFKHIKDYAFCSSSGTFGPKRAQGDKQIPEGFYYIDRFNPASFYHLSLGINYPNQSDKILCGSNKPGGDIFIHGACVTIGCIPITDDKIGELYVAAVEARNNGQTKIPVHIFPARMNKGYIHVLGVKGPESLFLFWENLTTGYTFFEENKRIPAASVNEQGRYIFYEE
ncbi:hypothetical protein RCC89_18365 [Cytophagaceae bacterium ABcell3]|nr:hypothetical protein RCC89_18365 [Cytophagaceae bacterium ABcell3]